jgi:hypothetical protein
VQKQAKKKKTANRPTKSAARPWTKPSLANDPVLDFEGDIDLRLLPEEVEAASSRELVGMFARRLLHTRWRQLQRKSYWLSRATHKNSWWARVKLYPEVKVPLPSWLTQKRDLDAQ